LVVVFFSAGLASPAAWPHTDLLLQIEQVTADIETVPSPSADLFIRRGELYRRHESWAAALADFATARDIQPSRGDLDWFEGRVHIEAGDYERGIGLVSRFIARNEPHASAYRYRAMALARTGDREAAARDYAAAISVSEAPSPALYRALVVEQIAAGRDGEAWISIDEGLSRFPVEVSLLGLGVDLALREGSAERALTFLERLPEPVRALPQWRLRSWLIACIGDKEHGGSDLSMEPAQARGTQAELIAAALAELGEHPQASECRRAGAAMLGARQP